MLRKSEPADEDKGADGWKFEDIEAVEVFFTGTLSWFKIEVGKVKLSDTIGKRF